MFDRLEKAAKARSKRRPFALQQEAIVGAALDQAVRCCDDGRHEVARGRLEALREKYPKNVALIEMLASIALGQGDHRRELQLCQELVDLAPQRPEVWMYLGTAHLNNAHPATARRIFQQHQQRWPDHEFADGTREAIALAEKMVRSLNLLGDGFESTELYELSEAHEQIVTDLVDHRLDRVVRRTLTLLERWPKFVPARNNLAEAYYHLGQLDRALQVAAETAEIAPDNMYAAACLIRLLMLGGDQQQACPRCPDLVNLPIGSMDHLIAAVDACSLLGRHNEVLGLIDRGEEYLYVGDIEHRARLYHLAAVAACHLGQRQRARESWQEALRIDPKFTIAAKNLADFRQPSDQQHGPWPFEMERWFPPRLYDQMHKLIRSVSSDVQLAGELRKLWARHPALQQVFSQVLRHAGPDSCEFVIRLVKCVAREPLLDTLREFAAGQRGSQQMRVDVRHWLDDERDLLDRDADQTTGNED